VNDNQGNEIEPNGLMTITMDVPQGYSPEKLKVYRKNADNSLTDMNAVYTNGKMVFTTNHLSTYALVENDTATVAATVAATAASDNTTASVSTGDHNLAWVYATAMGIALIGACCLIARRKKVR
jgi:hypothetical protein